MMDGVLSRRDLVRAGMLSGLVVAAPGLFAGCSDDGSDPPKDATGGIRLVSSDVARDAADPAAIGTAAASVLALGGGLYGQLVGAGGNLGLSPYSAAVALGMTVNGAVGTTRDEMLEVLAASDVESLDDGLNALTAYIESLAGPVPRSDDEWSSTRPTSCSARRDYPWEQPFLDAIARSFGAGVREVDFASDDEKARDAPSTRGPPSRPTTGSPRSCPRECSTSTPGWCSSTRSTSRRRGRSRSRRTPPPTGLPPRLRVDTTSVPMMRGRCRYAEGDGWRAARLLLRRRTLAMTVVLPDEGREQTSTRWSTSGGLADRARAAASARPT